MTTKPIPIGSTLFQMARAVRAANDAARKDPANICAACGKPKSLPCIPNIGERTVDKGDVSYGVGGSPASRWRMKLCQCEEERK